MTWRHLDWGIWSWRYLEDDVLLQTGRIDSLYRVSLLGMDSVESRVKRRKTLIKVPVALCITECWCFVKRSLESSTMPRYLICGLQGMAVCWNWSGIGVAGRHLVNNMASILLMPTRSFHLVKYLCTMVMAFVSRRAMVSVRQDCVITALSSAYNANCVLAGGGGGGACRRFR
jgi:hypothetical protein